MKTSAGKTIAAIGEVMIELAPFPSAPEERRELMALSYAGDTYNTSVYMSRLGLNTHYVTLLGDDAYSNQILARMATENIGAAMIRQLAGRTPGLYAIRNGADGEREFYYWRKEAPARELFSSEEASRELLQQLTRCNCVYFSGITLAIISETARANLYNSLRALRDRGITVAFDSNYRPRLWPDRNIAQGAMRDAMEHCDIALLTLDDEQLLWDDASVAGCRRRYPHISELILKRGAEDVVVISDGHQVNVPVPPVSQVVDTTGAGDTFNAGYLASRLQGTDPAAAAAQGIRCAGVVIQHRGGVIDKTIFAAALQTMPRSSVVE